MKSFFLRMAGWFNRYVNSWLRSPFFNRTVICLIPTVIATILVVNAYLKDPDGFSGFKLGIDLRGGTILVYEVDQELSEQTRGRDSGAGRARADTALADSLKRRLDPADQYGIIVRPLGESRVEILLPYGGQPGSGQKGTTESEVDKIKGLIQQVGSLEFRIMANATDDADALEAVRDYLRRARENPAGEEGKALEAAAKTGLPPPFPNRGPNESPFLFKNEEVRYEWVELGKHGRAEHGLSTKHVGQTRHGSDRFFYDALADARSKNDVLVLPREDRERSAQYSEVYYSRVSQNEKNPDESAAKQFDYFALTRISEKNQVKVGGDVTISAYVTQDSGGSPAVGFSFNSKGGELFYQVTYNNQVEGQGVKVMRQLAIILDGYLISHPTVNEPIRGSGIIHGKFERSEVERIVRLLRSGALPATLKRQPVSENAIGPTLGRDTIRSGASSILLAYVSILIFMMVYYRFAGLVATVALLANLLLTVGFMVLVNATFTLPGLAGLVLMLGMAVDANVLIYERVREERDRGMNLQTALRNGYDRAFAVIIDTHLSSIFTAIVLYTVGNDQLKGFGVSLTVGLIISLFTSLYMTRLIFDYWQVKGWLTQLRMMRLFSRPNINFMKIRYQMFALTVILTILGIGLFLFRGQKGLNVDFVGGTAYTGRLVKPVDIGTLRMLVSEDRQKTQLAVAEVNEVPDPSGRNKNTYEIVYKDGQRTIVALANPPEGTTPETRRDDVKERASMLKDWSVEQIFSGGSSGSESDLFNIRTTERERELVEVLIGRLFKDDEKNDLLAKNEITDAQPEATDYFLTFKNPVSRSTIKTLFERQFQAKLGSSDYVAADVFDIVEIPGEKPVEGRYYRLKLKINKDANEGIRNLIAAGDLPEVVESARKEFASRPQPERLEVFDGTLASETRSRALYAIVASWIAILLYLWFRFGNWTFGTAAVLCLVHDLCFTLGAIALCHYVHHTWIGQLLGLKDFKIDLPAVAALLTLVGYSVNEIIVNFARIREIRGKNPALSPELINASVNQTLSRTILTSTTVLLVSFVLYAFGGEGIHLFAFVMMVGVLISTYSSIYIASQLLLILGEGRQRGFQSAPAAQAT
ncbi:MAG TPA: protein translocase subunit SecD [Gemmataceae bacterium]|nr:protein translocase subunit SecD [Gemmataceae bacterium]